MLKALVRKEWRQLRMLRWSGLVIGAMTPFFLLIFSGDRGWLPGSVSSAGVVTVVQDLTPMMLSLAIWPMLTLMVVSSALTADRAAGTDAFLLQRPVLRRSVWTARLLASLAVVLLFLASHTLVWWLSVRLLGNPATFDEGAALGKLLTLGGVFTGVAFMAGAAGAAFVRTPMQGMLLGLVLTAIPLGVGSLLAGPLFFGYQFQRLPLGYGVPLLLLLGYLVGSYRTECRGEPAGRGRVRRGVTCVVIGLVAMPLFLGASAPFVMRLDARWNLGNTDVIPSRVGGAGLAVNNAQRAGWLIDTESHERLRFVAPPVYDAAWSDDGARLALLHAAGGTGRMLADPLLEVLDRTGSRIGQPIDCGECRSWWGTGLVWSGDRLVVPALVEGSEGLLILDPSTGGRRAVLVPRPVSWFNLLPAREGGSVFVLRIVRRPATAEDEIDAGRPTADGWVHRLDVDRGSLGQGTKLSGIGSTYGAPQALSPSGRRWLQRHEGDAPTRIIDIETGEAETLLTKKAVWLAGDDLAWLERREDGRLDLLVGRPGKARVVRKLERTWANLNVAPDGRKLLVTTREGGEDWRFARAIYDSASDRWQELTLPDDSWGIGAVHWAGPEKLAVVGRGSLGLLDPRNAGGVVSVIGNPNG
jgi:hypothetical protein